MNYLDYGSYLINIYIYIFVKKDGITEFITYLFRYILPNLSRISLS